MSYEHTWQLLLKSPLTLSFHWLMTTTANNWLWHLQWQVYDPITSISNGEFKWGIAKQTVGHVFSIVRENELTSGWRPCAQLGMSPPATHQRRGPWTCSRRRQLQCCVEPRLPPGSCGRSQLWQTCHRHLIRQQVELHLQNLPALPARHTQCITFTEYITDNCTLSTQTPGSCIFI